MKAVFVAGGTGGHVYPALEIARESKKSGVEIHWIGKEGSLEKDLSLKEGFNFEATKSSGFRKKNLRDKIISIYYLIFSLVKSILLFKKIKPDFIFCCGGYLSLGPGLASFLLRIPLFIHEQNSIAGSANRILSILAIKIFEGFPSSFKKNTKVKFVGNPVRTEIISLKELNRKKPSNKNLRLLILGGSQGSSQRNSIVIKALMEVKGKDNWEIIHQSGEADKSRLENFYSELNCDYKVESFIEEIGEAYLNADLVISRAGAMTISELIATNKPSILLPLPWATDDHQSLNAKFLKDLGAAEVVPSNEKNASELAKVISELAFDKERRLSMANSAKLAYLPEAAKEIFLQIDEAIKKDSK